MTTDIKYCHCRFAFEDARVERGQGRWSGDEVWVCSKCDGMHHVRQVWYMPRTVRRAPRNAVGFLSYNGQGDRGSAQLNFSLIDGSKASIISIHTHNRRPPTMPIQPTDLLLHTWERLDYYVVKLKEPGALDNVEQAQAAARAIAEVLTPMMHPFFENTNEIVREAVNRYENRNNPEYETPGLGQKSLAPHDKTPMTSSPVKQAAPAVTLSDKEKTGIKMALESKMFTPEQLAKSYNVPISVIREIGSN